MHQMVDLSEFKSFMATMQIQSFSMSQKHILRRHRHHCDGIVMMEEASQICVDLNQYDQKAKAKAVQIRAVRIDWILKDDDQ